MIITCEQVSNGHPDKICDQISDRLVDYIIANSKSPRAGIEVLAKNNTFVFGGEYRSDISIDQAALKTVVEDTINDIGLSRTDYDLDRLEIINLLDQQSPDIAQGVDVGGAGDQGMMYGYATDETPEMLPIPFVLATQLLRELNLIRNPNLKGDAKAQVTFNYDTGMIQTFLCSVQHKSSITNVEVSEIIVPIMQRIAERRKLNTNFNTLVNPTGRFVIGGTFADCGVTGRKLACDTYGGVGRIGGGNLGGKDPTKVDRSGAYMARKVAKTLIRLEMCKKCEVQIAYAIGEPLPISVNIECFGSELVPISEIIDYVAKNYDFSPEGIIEYLDLWKVNYAKTATFGHFGKSGFSWED